MYRWVAAWLVAALLLVGAVATLSIEEVFRTRGLGFGADAGSGCGVDVPDFAGCEFTLVSEVDLKASFVNIRMSRFFIDGFSDATPGLGLRCGSEDGVEHPIGIEVVGIGATLLFCPGRNPGDPVAEEVGEGVGEGYTFSVTRVVFCALTAAMVEM